MYWIGVKSNRNELKLNLPFQYLPKYRKFYSVRLFIPTDYRVALHIPAVIRYFSIIYSLFNPMKIATKASKLACGNAFVPFLN